MKQNKKLKKSISNKRFNKTSMFIIFFIMALLCIITLLFYKSKQTQEESKTTYYKGTLYDMNMSANLFDYITTSKDNIVFSPYNFHTNLAYLYNGVDNNSRNEIKNYLKKDETKINEEHLKRTSLISMPTTKTNYDTLYEELITNLKDKGYDKYSLANITSLSKEEKKELQLLLKKLSLTYSCITKTQTISESSIKNYTLTEKEITYNEYTLKSLLDDILDNYTEYQITNTINNYTEVYLNTKKINDKFIKNTKDYNINSHLNLKEDKINTVNTNIKNITNDKIKRIGETKLTNKQNFLVNTLYFDYSWEDAVPTSHVRESAFKNYDGTYSSSSMMYSEEKIYLENEYATGFIKYFRDKKYSFVAILPKKEDFTLSELNIDSLYKSAKKKSILVGLPKFEYTSEISLKTIHSELGIKELYTEKANLTKMTDDKIYIEENLQKNYISIGEKGTKESNVNKDNIEPFSYNEDTESIILNRPFAYLIVNNETNDIMLMGKIIKM